MTSEGASFPLKLPTIVPIKPASALDRMTGSRDTGPPKSARALSVPPDGPGYAGLRSLAMIGLVRIERNRRGVAMPSDEVVADAYEARRIVEATIVQHVAASQSHEQIEARGITCGGSPMRAARRQSHAGASAYRLPFVAGSMARDQFLRGFVETLASTTSLAVLLYDQSEAPSHAVAEHRELVQLLEQEKGAAASALMLRHLGRNQQRQERSPTGREFATRRSSVVGIGQSREKRHVRGEPAGYELGEEPHALRLARLALREEPERSEHAQGGARHPHQQLGRHLRRSRAASPSRTPAAPRRSAPRRPWS